MAAKKRKRRSRPYIHWSIKQKIWAMPCAVCGRQKYGEIVVDHIVPHSKGGASAPPNLQPLCKLCNGIKGNRLTNDEIRAYVPRHQRNRKR